MKAALDPNGMTFPHGFLDFLAPCPTGRNNLEEYEIDPGRLAYFNGVAVQVLRDELADYERVSLFHSH